MRAMSYLGHFVLNAQRVQMLAKMPKQITKAILVELIIEANSKGTTLDLSNKMIHANHVNLLVNELPKYTDIKALSLSNSEINDSSVSNIFKVLGKTSISSIDLSKNKLSIMGVRHIINAVKNNVFITKVILDPILSCKDALEELYRCIEINNQITKELSRSDIYDATVKTISSIFPGELSMDILEYINESESPIARSYLKKNYYPKIISWSYEKQPENNSKNVIIKLPSTASYYVTEGIKTKKSKSSAPEKS